MEPVTTSSNTPEASRDQSSGHADRKSLIRIVTEGQAKQPGPSESRSKEVAMHTPGPWRTASYDNGLTWKVETVEGRLAVASYIAGLRDVDEANARLIAAAPDLLEAAKGAVEVLEQVAEDYLRVDADIFALREAIAKAEAK